MIIGSPTLTSSHATGAFTIIGPTGLLDCSNPGISPCGPHSSFSIAAVGSQVYITDFSGNLYKVNTATGAAALATGTGIPPVPFTPVVSTNPNGDGAFGITDQALFASNGKLYSTFDAGFLNPPQSFETVVSPALYQIDPATGQTTRIGDTLSIIGAVAASDGTYYAFDDLKSIVFTLDLATGNTTFVSNFDSAIGVVTGASVATPEPAELTLTGFGFIFLVLVTRRQRLRRRAPFPLTCDSENGTIL